ncbi:barstar family protein [Streptomyces sp. NPDC057654]|uniref:barstar family protein n=1 Tax=Streptomyces sp. NPDC057654 TaxID=3346196 RepID=UPI00369A03B6
MPTEDTPQIPVKHWQDCTDVYDFLEQIRLRPGMWLPGNSLRRLEAILTGYRVALGVHAIDESSDGWPEEAFTRWLHQRCGTPTSLGWAAAIEHSTPPGSTPVNEFFQLLDAFRRESATRPAPVGRAARLLALEFMANTFVTLFWRRRLLSDTALRLEDRGFRVIRLAAGAWNSEQDLHRDIAAALRFPDYYGRKLAALDDCLGEVACYGPYDESPEGAGLVLSITDYDRFAAACPQTAQAVLDIVADQARHAAVLQRRFFCLLHSSDPDIRFEPVGATRVMWNSNESLDATRR